MSAKTLMTVTEFARMQTPDTEDFELVEGELIPLSSGTPKHSIIRDFVGDLLRSYLRNKRIGRAIGEVDCLISSDTVRRPDVSVFLGHRLKQIDLNTIPVPFAPDIAVEVLSSSESAVDVHRKVREYLGAGSKEVWILDHVNGELFVHTPNGIRLLTAEDALESPLLPGFIVPVGDFFNAE